MTASSKVDSSIQNCPCPCQGLSRTGFQMEIDSNIVPKSSVHEYYVQKIEELQLIVNEKGQNLRRLQAQRNELNAKGEHQKLFKLHDFQFLS